MNTKRILSAGLTVLAAVMAICSCKKEEQSSDVYASTITLSESNKTVLRGQSFQLKATVLPSNVTKPGVTWSVLNPEMANVDQNGNVKTLRPGVTYIVATSKDFKAKSSCRLTINYPERYYVVIQDEKGEDAPLMVYGYPTQERQFKVWCSEEKAHTYTWISDDPDAIFVDKNGKCTYKFGETIMPGYMYYSMATIKVESEDTFYDSIIAISNVRNRYCINGAPRDFEEQYGVAVDKEYTVALVWYDGEKDENLPVSMYTVESSDPSVLSVSKAEDTYIVKSSSTIGASAVLSATLVNGKVLTLGTYSVSTAVDGGTQDYTEIIR